MPSMKQTHCRLSTTDASTAKGYGNKLRRLRLVDGEGLQVVAIDNVGTPDLALDVVERKVKYLRRLDPATGKVSDVKENVDREFSVTVDLGTGLCTTPGGKRNLKLLVEMLQACGASEELTLYPVIIDLVAFVRSILARIDGPQLGTLTLDNLYVGKQLIGRFSAKSIDHRVDLTYLESVAGQIKGIKLGWFEDGAKRTVEVRSDGTLTAGVGKDEDPEDFFEAMLTLMFRHEINQPKQQSLHKVL